MCRCSGMPRGYPFASCGSPAQLAPSDEASLPKITRAWGPFDSGAASCCCCLSEKLSVWTGKRRKGPRKHGVTLNRCASRCWPPPAIGQFTLPRPASRTRPKRFVVQCPRGLSSAQVPAGKTSVVACAATVGRHSWPWLWGFGPPPYVFVLSRFSPVVRSVSFSGKPISKCVAGHRGPGL